VGSPASPPDLGALTIGVPLAGNRLIRGSVIAFRATPEARIERSRLTTVMQLPWLAAQRLFAPVLASGRAGDATVPRL